MWLFNIAVSLLMLVIGESIGHVAIVIDQFLRLCDVINRAGAILFLWRHRCCAVANRLLVATQDVALEEAPEEHKIDTGHDEDGTAENHEVGRAHAVRLNPHSIVDDCEREKAGGRERYEVAVGRHAVEPVVERPLVKLEQFSRVQKEAVDFSEQSHRRVRDTATRCYVVEEHARDCDMMR